MGCVDPWVGLDRDFSLFDGLGYVHYGKSTNKFEKNHVNAFKAPADKILFAPSMHINLILRPI